MTHPMATHFNAANLRHLRRWQEANPKGWFNDIRDAYLAMAAKPKAYRPQAPSDGWGTIMLDDEEIKDQERFEFEALLAAKEFYDDDEKDLFEIHGCTDGRLAKTMYLSLQAAQLCCGGKSDGLIRKVLNLAIAALPKDIGE